MNDATPSRQSVRVLVVDDDELLRAAYRRALERAGHRCTVASSVTEARRILRGKRRARFEVVLLDLNLPDGDGAELIPLVEETDPAAGIAVLSAHLDAGRSVELWGQVRIALPKPVGGELLLETIARLADRRAFDEGVAGRFASTHALSRREAEVLRLGLSGLSNKMIAQVLGCQEETVLTHWKHVYEKTGVHGYRPIVAAVLAVLGEGATRH